LAAKSTLYRTENNRFRDFWQGAGVSDMGGWGYALRAIREKCRFGKIAKAHGGQARIYPGLGSTPEEGHWAFATIGAGIAI